MSFESKDNLWWKHYHKAPGTEPIHEPFPDSQAVFEEGQKVKLKGKPDQVRRVLKVEWHAFRHEFVYVVETSLWLKRPESFARYGHCAYWFAPQLEAAEGE